MTIAGIYKITSPTNKIYIGSSKNIYKRWNDYKVLRKSEKQVVLHRSFKKYGIENHKFSIIERCGFNELFERERYWQEFYDVLGSMGLNCHLVNTDEKPKVQSEVVRFKAKVLSKRGRDRNAIKNLSPFKIYGIISFRNEKAWRLLSRKLTSTEYRVVDNLSFYADPYRNNIEILSKDYVVADITSHLGIHRNSAQKMISKIESLGIIRTYPNTGEYYDSFYVFNPYISFKDRYDIKEPMIRTEAMELFSDTEFVTM